MSQTTENRVKTNRFSVLSTHSFRTIFATLSICFGLSSTAVADHKLSTKDTIYYSFKERQLGSVQLRLHKITSEKDYSLLRGTLTSRRSRLHPQKVTAMQFNLPTTKRLIFNFLLPNNTSQRSYEVERFEDGTLKVRSAPQRALSAQTCGETVLESPLKSARSTGVTSSVSNSAPFITSAATVKYTASLSVDCDFGCSQLLGATEAKAKIAQFVNTASAYYENDFGIALALKNVIVRTSQETYPLSLQDSSVLLNAFRIRAPELGSANLRHLITSLRTIPDDVAGLSYVGSTCVDPAYSVGFTKHFNSVFTPFIMAHEIGHSFGGDHDPDDQGIMAAVLALPLATQFSEFSRVQISTHLNSMGKDFCLQPAAVVGAETTPTPVPTAVQVTGGTLAPGTSNATAKIKLSSRVSPDSVSMLTTVSNLPAEACTLTLLLGRNTQEARESPLAVIQKAVSVGKSRITFSSRNEALLRDIPRGRIFTRVSLSCPELSSPLTASSTLTLRGTAKITLRQWIKKLADTTQAR